MPLSPVRFSTRATACAVREDRSVRKARVPHRQAEMMEGIRRDQRANGAKLREIVEHALIDTAGWTDDHEAIAPALIPPPARSIVPGP